MTAFVLLKLLTAAVSLLMASSIVSRDPGFRVNRLMGGVVGCTAWWALCEAAWSLQTDAEIAAAISRASAPAWLLIGSLFFDTFATLVGRYRSRLYRLTPVIYTAAVLMSIFHMSTPLCLATAVPAAWGWRFEFGPLFPLSFATAIIPPMLVFINWRTLYPLQGSRGERRISQAALIASSLAVLVAASTDVVLPYLGTAAPELGSTAIVVALVAILGRLRRYGYSFLSAGAFAQEILEAVNAGVVLLHSDGRVRDCNAAFERLAGTSSEALRETSIRDLLPALPQQLMLGNAAREAELVRVSGEKIPVLTSRPVPCVARHRVVGAALVVRDLREVSDLRHRLVTSARLAAVGDLSAGIAEEISGPADVVHARLGELRWTWRFLEVAAEKAGLPKELRGRVAEGAEVIGECLEGTERISRIASEVRGFAHGDASQRESTDVVWLLERALSVASARSSPGVAMIRELREVPPVLCARHEMLQVLINLLVNAFQAVGEMGQVCVSTEHRASKVLIHIRDDGVGVDSELLERIFDPFFTTKSVGEGTGLGLAISYHIVSDHGGEIRVLSQSGGGATFSVELPVL